MGLFDSIHISREVLSAYSFECEACGEVPEPETEWQTKSLSRLMANYYLRQDGEGAVRLYLLDRPSDRRFWRPWSEEEIAESESDAQRGGIFTMFRKKPGEGCFVLEAYRPENRRQRFMGELPHQWVEVDAHCPCGADIERHINFVDGVAVTVAIEPPGHEPSHHRAVAGGGPEPDSSDEESGGA